MEERYSGKSLLRSDEIRTVHVGEDVEQEEHFSTVGGNADWYNHSRKHSQLDYFLASVPPGRVCFFSLYSFQRKFHGVLRRSFDLVNLSIGWSFPSSAFCKVGPLHGVPDFLDILFHDLFGFGVFLD
ncbi:hypothetical protein STEG23_000836 [Scotinomys teguina]